MRRRPFVALLVAMVASLVMTSAAVAGGWATVTLADPPAEPTAGGETTLGLTVLQHGETPVSWPRITVVATDAATGATIRAEAQPTAGQTGRYTATLTFPTGGSWTLAYESADLIMDGTATLAVAASAAAAPAAASATADLAAMVAMGGLVLLFIVGFGALVVHDRRADRRGQPQASGG
jgi:hypothetical protein